MIADLAIFYAIGAFLVGPLVPIFDKCSVKWREGLHPPKYPRIMIGIISGLVWPWLLTRLIIRGWPDQD